MDSNAMLRKANRLITRADALIDLGEFDRANELLDEAERLTDEAERIAG